MMALVGAKTAASARERLRVAKKKADQILEAAGDGTSGSTLVTPKKTPKKAVPAGGIDKKTPSKVKKGPRKVSEPEVKEEEVVEEADTEDGV